MALTKVNKYTNLKIKEEKSAKYEEEYKHIILPNGLNVYLYNKEGFNSTYVTYSVNYGSIDNEFVPYNMDEYVKMPEGIAHFLEHKTFECADGIDATEKLMDLGADANAYTSYEETVYLFSTTENVNEAVITLLDFVSEAAYTKESVKKEQDIIEQERAMYADNPSAVVKRNALKLIYKNNPISIDIAGTKSSIKEITKEKLDLCHKTFYQPSNMRLIIVGKFDYDSLLKAIVDNQDSRCNSKEDIKRRRYYENEEITKQSIIEQMDVNMPIVLLAIRIPQEELSYVDREKRELYLTYWLKNSFDHNSSFYQQIKKTGLVSSPLVYQATISETYQYMMVSGTTTDEKEFSQLVKKELLSIKNKSVDIDKYNRYVKKVKASVIRSFSSLEGINNNLQEADDAKMSLFEYIDKTIKLSIEELKATQAYFDEEYLVESIIIPKKRK